MNNTAANAASTTMNAGDRVPRMISAGTVVKKATGRTNVKKNWNPIEYAPIGYFPASMKARSTSVAFQIFVNQIVVVPTANQSEYKITTARSAGKTPSAYA
jgi:hypothetical protein